MTNSHLPYIGIDSATSTDLALMQPQTWQRHTDDNATAPIDPYVMFHRALRGRYLMALWLAAVCAIVGATAGYFSTRPLYKSEGVVRVAYSMPAILQETDQNKPVAMFDSLLRSLQMRMSSRTLVELALKDSNWQSTGRGASASTAASFAGHLTVEHAAGTEHLRVMFTDADPAVSAAAVRAVIAAFKQSYDDQDQQLQKQRLAALGQHRRELMDTLGNVGSRADQLALMDSMIAEYLKRQASLEGELKLLEVQGYMPNHRRVAELRSMLDRTSAMIQQYSDVARKLHNLDREYAAVTTTTGTNPFENPGIETRDSIKSSEVWQNDSNARRDLLSVQGNLMQMQRLQADSEIIRKELADTTQRMEALKVESGLGGRVEVISNGDPPLAPFKDSRVMYAAAGAMAGAAMPWLFFGIVGTLRPIYRRSEDTASDLGDRLPLLGTLPALRDGFSNQTLTAGAAYSVHQTRVRLQTLRDREGMRTFLITSPCAGEGKTSLTTSLGLSFAASGSRTLLIDLDFIGRRLSRGFRCERHDGAFEALLRNDARGCVREVVPALWVMPAGAVDSQHACTISSDSLRLLLAEMRDTFDVVLIDGGPVLGSVETSLAAPVVDGIVLTISRGQQPSRVHRTLKHLAALGGRMAGMVFNRAQSSDFTRSSYSPSMSSTHIEPDRVPQTNVTAQRGHSAIKADLLVQSVMAYMPAELIGAEAPMPNDSPAHVERDLSEASSEATPLPV